MTVTIGAVVIIFLGWKVATGKWDWMQVGAGAVGMGLIAGAAILDNVTNAFGDAASLVTHLAMALVEAIQ